MCVVSTRRGGRARSKASGSGSLPRGSLGLDLRLIIGSSLGQLPGSQPWPRRFGYYGSAEAVTLLISDLVDYQKSDEPAGAIKTE